MTDALGNVLGRFLNDLDLARDGLHGGYFPHALREPLAGDVFLVGDAAGQCLGLTGEGIRPALFFGNRLGSQLRRVLDSEIGLSEARRVYRDLVMARKPIYDLLCFTQRVLPRLPLSVVQSVLTFVNQPAVLRQVLSVYIQSFWLERNATAARPVVTHLPDPQGKYENALTVQSKGG